MKLPRSLWLALALLLVAAALWVQASILAPLHSQRRELEALRREFEQLINDDAGRTK